MPIRVSCSCGRIMHAPDHAAGKRAKCPHCGSPIDIPEGQQLPSADADLLRFARPNPAGSEEKDLANDEESAEPEAELDDRERECPYCAETIKKRAKVCRHCGATIRPASGEAGATRRSPSGRLRKRSVAPPRSRGLPSWVWIVGVAVVSPCLLCMISGALVADRPRSDDRASAETGPPPSTPRRASEAKPLLELTSEQQAVVRSFRSLVAEFRRGEPDPDAWSNRLRNELDACLSRRKAASAHLTVGGYTILDQRTLETLDDGASYFSEFYPAWVRVRDSAHRDYKVRQQALTEAVRELLQAGPAGEADVRSLGDEIGRTGKNYVAFVGQWATLDEVKGIVPVAAIGESWDEHLLDVQTSSGTARVRYSDTGNVHEREATGTPSARFVFESGTWRYDGEDPGK